MSDSLGVQIPDSFQHRLDGHLRVPLSKHLLVNDAAQQLPPGQQLKHQKQIAVRVVEEVLQQWDAGVVVLGAHLQDAQLVVHVLAAFAIHIASVNHRLQCKLFSGVDADARAHERGASFPNDVAHLEVVLQPTQQSRHFGEAQHPLLRLLRRPSLELVLLPRGLFVNVLLAHDVKALLALPQKNGTPQGYAVPELVHLASVCLRGPLVVQRHAQQHSSVQNNIQPL
mmetsp:Transcript_6298/g.12007  ORF Transcript_6298/g.12007 Transcript_6298/m.12007 type:complete len:226 (-) Transcript_6298:301-978(-)